MSENLTIEQIFEIFGDELADVIEELNDARFGGRQHGSRATSAVGCRGVLCEYAEKMRSRIRNERKAKREGREYNPYGRKYDRDDLLEAIVKWHKVDLMKRKIAELESA